MFFSNHKKAQYIRERMVAQQLENRAIHNPEVLKAMRCVPRHQFVDQTLVDQAYADRPLPIGEGQTISQPYMVALMSQALALTGQNQVLEIGTGSGYQTAILAELSKTVFTIERLTSLGETAKARLTAQGYENIHFFFGDGTMGWPEKRSFDRIIVTAGAPIIPEKLLEQLTVHGKLVIPLGDQFIQQLLCITKQPDHTLTQEKLTGCRFVPLVGQQGWR
ncbi:protein-L-isoaspartate(D-aspartate) O-methyltransferase [Magnetococcales bacterium HHB-1]